MEITKRIMNPWVIVVAVAFGYFVDLYDLLLFSSVRSASLKEIGITGEQASDYALTLMNITVLGMFIGGFAWGILADKKGRMTVLFASIITYTIANFVNAYIHDVHTYEICRFVAGFGLAGELGVGITLISEILPNSKRTTATTIISGFGMMGAVTAGALTYFLSDTQIFNMSSWRFLFQLGGILGLALLVFRVRTVESSLFQLGKLSETKKGSLALLFSDRKRALKFLWCILAGLPIFFIVGIFVGLAPEYGKLEGITTIQASLAVLFCYVSIGAFTMIGTWLSGYFKTRKKILFVFLFIQFLSIGIFLFVPAPNATLFYLKIALLGAGIGNWGVVVVNSAEQFGTNLRATVTTAVPNIIRASLFPLSEFIFKPLKPHFGIVNSAAIISAFAIILAFIAIYKLKDNFENEVAYEEI